MKYLILGLALLTTETFAKKFELDSAHSSIGFSVNHLGIIPVKGKFKKFTGTFDYNEKNKTITNLVVKIEVDTIDTNEEDRDAHLRNKDFFHVRDDSYDVIEANKYITFKVAKLPVNQSKFKGKLKILKTERNVELKGDVKAQKAKGITKMIGFNVSGELNRQKFGLTWQKPGQGLLTKAAGKAVGDTVTMTISVLAKPAKK